MGAEITGAIILGIASLAGAGIAAGTASASNSSAQAFQAMESEESRKWASSENAKARQYSTSMYETQFRNEQTEHDRRLALELASKSDFAKQMQDYLFKNYNSPSAQAEALKAAGLNPAVLLGSSSNPFGSMMAPGVETSSGTSGVGVSSPSLLGASPSGAPAFVNPGQSFSTVIPSIADSVNKLAQSNVSQQEAKKMSSTLPLIIDHMTKQNNGLELANTYQSLHNDLYQLYGDEEYRASIEGKWNSAYLSYMQGDTQTALKEFYESLKMLNDQKHEFNKDYLPTTLSHLNAMITNLSFDNRLKQAQAFDAYESGREHQAGRELKYSQAENINYTNDELMLHPEVREALGRQIIANANVAEQQGAINEQTARKIAAIAEQIEYANSHKEFEYWKNSFIQVIDAAGEAAGNAMKIKFGSDFIDIQSSPTYTEEFAYPPGYGPQRTKGKKTYKVRNKK